ncbi:MAG: hypothetical protein Q8O86_03215 [Dehalococcoidia bacterium]|nr:hypothetical protein [Dehalococcoidia bacterium]
MQDQAFVNSDSGVTVYKRFEDHPLLSGTDLRHPDFLRKAEERFTKGKVKGLPKICSENSEDARTWCHFSHLLKQTVKTSKWLRTFFEIALEGKASPETLESTANTKLYFWHGKKTPENMYYPPASRTVREGATEVDLTLALGRQALVFLEAKYSGDITRSTKYDARRDQIIRNLDVGSWQARQRGFREFYFILITSDRNDEKAYTQMMGHYRHKPEALREMLPYRDDLADIDFETLAANIGWITWEEIPEQAGKSR